MSDIPLLQLAATPSASGKTAKRTSAARNSSCPCGGPSSIRWPGWPGVSWVSIPSTRRLLTYAPPWVMIRRASPLLLARPDFDQGVDDRQPVAGEPVARQFLARHVGEDAGQLGVGKLADFGAEEDFGGPLGRAEALVAVDQPGQLGGQPPLGPPLAGVGLMLGQQRRRSRPAPGR